MVLAAMLTDLWPRSRFIFGWIGPGRRYLQLQRISFQGLPELLSIAAHLTDLRFLNIPRNGYISPEGVITSISALTKLEELTIEVGSSPQSSRESSPDKKSQRSPPPTRALVLVLFPTSTQLQFTADNEYTNHFVARIDAPLLDNLGMTVLHDLVFGAPQFTEFINRTPRLKPDDATYTFFSHSSVRVTLPRPFNKRSQAANHVGWFTIPDYISSSGMCQIYLSGPQSCGKYASTSTPKNVGMKTSTMCRMAEPFTSI